VTNYVQLRRWLKTKF